MTDNASTKRRWSVFVGSSILLAGGLVYLNIVGSDEEEPSLVTGKQSNGTQGSISVSVAQSSAAAPEQVLGPNDYRRIFNDFASNTLRGNALYKGKKFEATGSILQITEGALIIRLGGVEASEILTAGCVFGLNNHELLLVSVGQSVTVAGEITDGVFLNLMGREVMISLKNCELKR